jgi:hypothetical protein
MLIRVAVVAACLLGCGGPRAPAPAPAPLVPIVAPGAETTAPAARVQSEPCVVRGDGYTESVTIYADSAGEHEIASVLPYNAVVIGATLDDLEAELVPVQLGGQGLLRISGFAARPRGLVYRRNVPVLHDNIVAQRFAELGEIQRIHAGRLLVTHRTTFESPSRVEVDVACADVRWGPRYSTRDEDASGPAPNIERVVYTSSGSRLTLLDAPHGQPRVTIVFESPAKLDDVRVDGDFVFIRVGSEISFQGWATKDSLLFPPERYQLLGGGHRHRTLGPKGKPRKLPVAELVRESRLFVGENEPREIGAVERGALVRPGAAHGELTSFELDAGFVEPPRNERFFVETSALSEPRQQDRPSHWRPPPLPIPEGLE